jgi:hypothetical protein
MKKPYLKRYKTIHPFTVWIVDGDYIRNHLSIKFTNFGQHYTFRFIPQNEFWIDKEHADGEEEYYITHMLVEHKLRKSGMDYNSALDKADIIERKERKKFSLLRKLHRKKINNKELIKKIHKKLLKEYTNKLIKKYNSKIKVWIVDGELVRDVFFVDFTEGGHDKVYFFIPKNEIWVDNDVINREVKFILLHELHERNLMGNVHRKYLKSKNPALRKKARKIYLSAHRSASILELVCRRNPKLLNKKLEEELKKAHESM